MFDFVWERREGRERRRKEEKGREGKKREEKGRKGKKREEKGREKGREKGTLGESLRALQQLGRILSSW